MAQITNTEVATVDTVDQGHPDLVTLFDQVEHSDTDANRDALLGQITDITDGMLSSLQAADRANVKDHLQSFGPVFAGERRQMNVAALLKTLAKVRRSVIGTLVERKILGTKGYSQTDVAKYLGITQGRVSQLKSEITGADKSKRDRDDAPDPVTDEGPDMPGPNRQPVRPASWVAEQVVAFLATMPDAVTIDDEADRTVLEIALSTLTEWTESISA